MTPTELLIRRALLERNLSVLALAEKIDCKPSYVYDVVKNRRGKYGASRGPRAVQARVVQRRIARYLKIPIGDLWPKNGNAGTNGGHKPRKARRPCAA